MPQKRLDEQFVLSAKTNLFDLLARLLKALEARFQNLEKTRTSIEETIDFLRRTALDRINETITPLISSTLARLRETGSIFRARSLSTVTIGLGLLTIFIREEDRDIFAHGGYVFVTPTGDMTRGFAGPVAAYVPETGELAITSEYAWGVGSATDWTATATAPFSAHEMNTNNPHATTAAQVGAYTVGQSDAAIEAARVAAVGTGLALSAALAIAM